MFIDPQILPHRYEEPTTPNAELMETQKSAGGGGMETDTHGPDQDQQGKHNMFLFSDDEIQNSIIKLAEKTGTTPTSHRDNIAWEAHQRALRRTSAAPIPLRTDSLGA